MDEVSSQGTSVPLRQDDVQRLFHLILLNPSCGGQIALTSERSESLARRSVDLGGDLRAQQPSWMVCGACCGKGARSTACPIVLRPECRYQARRSRAPLRGFGAWQRHSGRAFDIHAVRRRNGDHV